MTRLIPALCSIFCLIPSWSSADDIDIYLHDRRAEAAPYLLILLDYHPDIFRLVCDYGPLGSCLPPYMSQPVYDNLPANLLPGERVSRLDVFRALLLTLTKEPEFEKIRVSLAVSNFENGGTIVAGYVGPQGQSLRPAIEPVLDALNALQAPEDARAHPFQPRESYHEWLRYLNGRPVVTGLETAGNFGARPGELPVPGHDRAILSVDNNRYQTPFSGNTHCPKLFSLVWAMSPAQLDTASAPDLTDILGHASSSATSFEEVLREGHNRHKDLVPNLLGGVNHLEKTWLISAADGPADAAVWARAGGSASPLDIDDPAGLERALHDAMREMISVSVTELPTSDPIGLWQSTAVGDALYLALFDPRQTVRWRGNLKKLRFRRAAQGGVDEIVDANGEPAFTGGGQINVDALTYWTDANALPASADGLTSIRGDGPRVDRGGAGQNIPGFVGDGVHPIGDLGDRALYVEPAFVHNGVENALLLFDAEGSGIGSAAADLEMSLRAAGLEEAQDLIRWARGQDVDDEDGDGNTWEARRWIMASAIHSKPAVLNYGAVNGYSSENPSVRVFIGTGDGILHAIDNTTAAGAESGAEVFGFVPREMLAAIAQRRTNVESGSKMSYGVDGEPVFFTVDHNGDGNLNWAQPENDEAYVYFGLRRGGQSYYALNVSNPGAVPTLQWKITRTEGGDFDELGLSFSTPLVGKVKFAGRQTDVVIFAGGYNGGWDASNSRRIGKDLDAGDDGHAGADIGNAIYIVDARTGSLVWKAVLGATTSTAATSSNTRFEHSELVDSIPSSIAGLKTPAGNFHRLYVGDTGGAIWRVDLPVGNDPDDEDHRRENWFISKLAELGTDGLTTDRRFFHPPDLVRSKEDSGEPFDGLLISSGNRANPNGTEVRNYHFYLKDPLVVSGHPAVRTRAPIRISESAAQSDLPDVTLCTVSGLDFPNSNCERSLDTGWMIKMNRPGEKSLATPLVDGGKVFFTSYVPSSTDGCQAVEGQSYSYLVNLESGLASFRNERLHPLGAGLSSGVITLGEQLLNPLGGLEYTGCQGKLCDSFTQKLQRIYWREPAIDLQ